MNDKNAPANRSTRRPIRLTLGPAIVLAVCWLAPAAARAQAPPPEEPVVEELVVVESSILLQRPDRVRAENLSISIDSRLAEAVAVYPLKDVEFPTTVVFDLCETSFSRLAHAVGMVAAVSEQIRGYGPVSVVSTGRESRVLLAASRDALDFEAALAVVLRSSLGGCAETTPLSALARLRQGLESTSPQPKAPSLLVAYGFDHQTLGADDIARLRADFAREGRELAGAGRTLVALLPEEGETRLEEKEVRPLLGDPNEAPPRTINLGAVLGALIRPKQMVPNDPRLMALASDPRNDLLRELIGPGQGRLFAFPRQIEAFARNLGAFQVLFYRSRVRESQRAGDLVPIEVRAPSGQVIETARVTSRRAPP